MRHPLARVERTVNRRRRHGRRYGPPRRLRYRIVMITLYDNAFSPFARKVRMVLEHKGLPFEADRRPHAPRATPRLAAVNPRSRGAGAGRRRARGDQLAAHRRLPRASLPRASRVSRRSGDARRGARLGAHRRHALRRDHARRLERRLRLSRTTPGRAGLLEAAREDLAPIYADLERTLSTRRSTASFSAARSRSPIWRSSRT